tara:strand:+ start:831 stop:1760 length:930 start_codon:yes stop_codon:yes gene_type:complete
LETVKNISKEFSEDEITFFIDSDLSKYSTMKLKAKGNLFLVHNEEALKKLIVLLNTHKLDYQVIGWGANTVLPEQLKSILIKLKFPFDKKVIDPTVSEYHLPASTPLNIMTSVAQKHGLKGWEVFTGIPGSLGGAIYMNAGTNLGEIGDLITEVSLLEPSGSIRVHKIGSSDFSYRHNHFVRDGEIIISARIKHRGIDSSISQVIKTYLEKRMETQPLKEKTCGCMFKNSQVQYSNHEITCRAGLYIDIMGLGGFGLKKDLRISPKHANFMENKEMASRSDVVSLIDFTLNELEAQYGIQFEKEVQISN